MIVQSQWQRIALIYCGLFGLVALAYFFADRPLAGELRTNLAGDPIFPWLTHIVDPLAPLASIAVAFAAARALARGSLTPLESAILRVSCAILIAWALKEELKWVFGRTWPETWIKNNPNPSYFGNGTYGFFPFHGGTGLCLLSLWAYHGDNRLGGRGLVSLAQTALALRGACSGGRHRPFGRRLSLALATSSPARSLAAPRACAAAKIGRHNAGV